MPNIKMKTLEKISNNLNAINVSVGKIEEHLKTLNGTVARHEQNISELYSENKQQFKTIAKIGGIGVASGTLGGIVVAVVLHFI